MRAKILFGAEPYEIRAAVQPKFVTKSQEKFLSFRMGHPDGVAKFKHFKPCREDKNWRAVQHLVRSLR